MLVGILVFLFFALAIFSFILFMFCSKHLTWPIWVKTATAILILLVIISSFIVMPITFGALLDEATHAAKISITEIEEIYESGENSTYFVKLKGSDKLQAVTGEIGEGNTNYIVKTVYTNLTDKLNFWLGVEKTHYKIVVTNPNVIQKVPEMK